MKRKAIVFRNSAHGSRNFPWYWQHECRSWMEPGGAVHKGSSGGYLTQRGAFLAAWLHVASCDGKREYPER